jgi:hypothetical protein
MHRFLVLLSLYFRFTISPMTLTTHNSDEFTSTYTMLKEAASPGGSAIGLVPNHSPLPSQTVQNENYELLAVQLFGDLAGRHGAHLIRRFPDSTSPKWLNGMKRWGSYSNLNNGNDNIKPYVDHYFPMPMKSIVKC